jgi:hypothetical protein
MVRRLLLGNAAGANVSVSIRIRDPRASHFRAGVTATGAEPIDANGDARAQQLVVTFLRSLGAG